MVPLRLTLLLGLALAPGLPLPAVAQGPGGDPPTAPVPPREGIARVAAAVAGGAAGALLGWHLGGVLGAQLNDEPCVAPPDFPVACEWAGPYYWDEVGSVIGAVALESIGIPLGTWLAAGRDDPLRRAVWTSAGLGAVGIPLVLLVRARVRDVRVPILVGGAVATGQVMQAIARLGGG